jgi:hypothetical protein
MVIATSVAVPESWIVILLVEVAVELRARQQAQ